MRKPVLVIAEAANPEWVSVPLVGWSHAQALAQQCDVHLVTQIRNRPAIERANTAAKEVTFIDSEAVAKATWQLGKALRGGAGKGWTTLMAATAPAYYYFEYLFWERFKQRIQAGEFSLVHRITPLSPTLPSLLAKRCRVAGVPFVLGPLNGGVPWPDAFDRERRREREWLSYIRGVYRLLPGYRETRKLSSAIICGSKHTLNEMPDWCKTRCIYIPENGIDPERFSVRRSRRASLPLRLIFVGRLVPYKGADILLSAAAPLLKEGLANLTIVGDGPERPTLEAQIKAQNIGHAVNFEGWLEHAQVQHKLAESDLMVFPSIREFGGAVVLEAMAIGVPSAAVNYAGPAELMTEQTAFPIPLGNKAELISRFEATLLAATQNPAELDKRGDAAWKRIQALFTWEKKALQTMEVYKWALKERAHRPEFDWSA